MPRQVSAALQSVKSKHEIKILPRCVNRDSLIYMYINTTQHSTTTHNSMIEANKWNSNLHTLLSPHFTSFQSTLLGLQREKHKNHTPIDTDVDGVYGRRAEVSASMPTSQDGVGMEMLVWGWRGDEDIWSRDGVGMGTRFVMSGGVGMNSCTCITL